MSQQGVDNCNPHSSAGRCGSAFEAGLALALQHSLPHSPLPFLAPTYFISAPGSLAPTPDVRARELRSPHLPLATALSDLFMAMPDSALPSPPPSSRYANRSPILAQFCICSVRLSLRIPPSASPARARAGRDCTRSRAVDEAARSCRLLIVSGWSISRFFRISPARIFRAARSLTGDAVRAVEAIEWDCVPGL
ncbi:hypothetical protein M758_3G079900 [Ceratodon purpureus]|nr:hypothetical protein M758_3G079900 [Ceratodon purpureus]